MMRSAVYRQLFRFFVNPLLDIIYPPLCHHCNSLLPPGRSIICQNCWLQIQHFSGELDHALDGKSFDNIFILFEYGPIVRKLIHLLKYQRYLSLCGYLSQEAGIRFPQLMTSNYSAIIPVPLHKTRRRERGYNQSEEIARALAKSLNLSLRSELLLRLRHTSTQTKKTRTEREENMQNAFSCPFQLKDEKVLLVDDVITTGSTVEACIRSLRQAGAGYVDVFAIAHPRETS